MPIKRTLIRRLDEAAEQRPARSGVMIGAPVGVALLAVGDLIGIVDIGHPLQLLWGDLSPGLLPIAVIIAWAGQYRSD